MKDVTPKGENQKSGKFFVRFNFSGFNIKIGRKLYGIFFLLMLVYYYIMLPPIHYASKHFWIFVGIIFAGVLIIEALSDGLGLVKNQSSLKEVWSSSKKKYKILLGFFPTILLLFGGSRLIFSPFLFAKPYSQLISIEEADFEEDFPQVDINQIPLVDRDTAIRLGNRHLGALTQLVSQFVASEEYTQVNIKDYPYRVSPLEYAGFFKWLNNFQEGIPNYLKVDNVSGQVTLEKPDQPIKYSYADLFGRDIYRHLRFNYPFTLFGNPSFEVDDQGVPYYIATTYRRHFLFYEPEADGLITVNAMTGEHTHYELDQIPSWVDRVHSAELIMHQLTLNGKYKNGFWNTVFSNEGVTQPTEGYSYLPMNDDLYLYTGITSIVSDESNIGFVLVNMRTKEAKMYPLTAAEEYSAMASAEGSVQEKGYTATFPLLINLNGKALYVLSLKDASGLIKAYALVDVQNYQTVYVEPTVEKLLQSYAAENPISIENLETDEALSTIQGQIDKIQAVVKDGNTVYYFMLDGKIYQAPIQLNDKLPFLEDGEEVLLEVDSSQRVRSIDWN